MIKLVDYKAHMQDLISLAFQLKTPFAARILCEDQILATTVNTTSTENDPTAHVELNALKQLKKINWTGDLTLISTMEPCPMCMGAAIWSNIKQLIYGVSIEQISAYHDQIHISCQDLLFASNIDMEIQAGILEKECMELLKIKKY